MEFTQWIGIVALAVALIVAGVLIYLYKQGKMTSGSISSVAALIDKMTEVLRNLGQDDTLVGVLSDYAAKAVRIVEQMVKNGQLEKDDTLRKEQAKMIVEKLALADGADMELLHQNGEVVDDLIEAAVHDMQETGVSISFGEEAEDHPANEDVG